ncbi:MAG: PQQ-dependent sugar dehydrogenase [Cyanobacteriota bacterium]|nr:PQQ-dependent sugar dehydrogenase [Cyanobacteriota bacterium]
MLSGIPLWAACQSIPPNLAQSPVPAVLQPQPLNQSQSWYEGNPSSFDSTDAAIAFAIAVLRDPPNQIANPTVAQITTEVESRFGLRLTSQEINSSQGFVVAASDFDGDGTEGTSLDAAVAFAIAVLREPPNSLDNPTPSQVEAEVLARFGLEIEISGTIPDLDTSDSAEAVSLASGSIHSRRLIRGLDNPLFVTSPPDDFQHLFILEQKTGRIRIWNLTRRRPLSTFLTIPASELLSEGYEQGLLGLAFHPQFASNRRFFVSYTARGGGNAGQTKVVEYQATSDTTANPNPVRTLLSIPQPAQNHNGGWLDFGSDGYLYWASGDGGGSGFLPGIPSSADNSQDITDNLLGKILRLDVEGDDFPADNSRNYRIPPSNPFVGITGDDEIWAYGLRNPWRNSFDRLTGDLYIADVGQDSREEVNVQPASSSGGENYGWNIREGTLVIDPDDNPPNLVDPVYEYDHSVGQSITGGYVYRGFNTLWQGTYFFADFSSGRIWSLRYEGGLVSSVTERTQELVPNRGSIDQIASFGEDAAGNLYIVDLDGEVFRLEFP